MRVRLFTVVAGLLLALSFGAPAAHARSYDWVAASHTAMAITGNIKVSAHSITFGNGVRIHIVPVSAEKPQVFRLKPFVNPTLLNGNKLCGKTPPTFIVLNRVGDMLYMKVSDTPGIPEGRPDPLPEPGTCATYNFERAH